jgi:hypothetical protein
METGYAVTQSDGSKVTYEDPRGTVPTPEAPPASILCCEVCGELRFDPAKPYVSGWCLQKRFGVWVCPKTQCLEDARLRAFRNWVHGHPREAKSRIGVPPLYLEVYDSPVSNVHKRVKALAGMGNFAGLYVFGPPGTGKTTVLSAWLDSVLPLAVTVDGLSARWTLGSDVLSDLKAAMERNRTEDVFRGFVEFKLLVIDDFGTEYFTEWAKATFYRLIEKRLNSLHFTAISSTLDAHELYELDPRLASRLALFQQVKTSSGDFRESQVTREYVADLVAKNVQTWGGVRVEDGSPSTLVTGSEKVGR